MLKLGIIKNSEVIPMSLSRVEKYAELDEDDQLNIQAERVAFLAAKSDVDPEHAEAYLQEEHFHQGEVP